MKFLTSKKAVAVAVALVVAAVVSYGAFAYFSSTGAGTGQATVVGSVGTGGIVIAQLPYAQGEYEPALVPGGLSDSIDVQVYNNSKGTLYVGTVTAVVDPAWSYQPDGLKPACTAADFTIGGSVVFDQDLASGQTVNSNQPTGMTIAMKNRSDTVAGDGSGNQDNCAGAPVPLIFSSN